MSIEVTINPPDQIAVTSVNANEFNISVTSPPAISVTASPQSGLQGLKGDIGIGIPPFGLTGQHLAKVTNTSYDTQWVPAVGSANDKQILFSDTGTANGDEEFVYDKNLKAVSIGKAVFLPDNPLGVSSNIDSYLQVNIQNKNGGVAASSDYIATADDGTDSGIYMDMGIANSGYVSDTWDESSAHDGYVWVDGGDLSIGSLSVGKKIRFAVAQTEHELHPADRLMELDHLNGLNMMSGFKVKENGFSLTDLITEVSGATAETAAFAAGSKIVIRSDLLV